MTLNSVTLTVGLITSTLKFTFNNTAPLLCLFTVYDVICSQQTDCAYDVLHSLSREVAITTHRQGSANTLALTNGI